MLQQYNHLTEFFPSCNIAAIFCDTGFQVQNAEILSCCLRQKKKSFSSFTPAKLHFFKSGILFLCGYFQEKQKAQIRFQFWKEGNGIVKKSKTKPTHNKTK